MRKNENPQVKAKELCDLAVGNRCIGEHRFFVGYALSLLRRAKWYTVWKEFLDYFRKFRMFALIAKMISFLFVVLQTGALVLVSTALFLIVIPLLCALMLGILLTALLESHKSNRYLQKALRDKQTYVLFLSKQKNQFFRANVRLLSESETHAVLIVSPYWISGKGLNDSHFYCTFRREEERVFLIRRYYFFQLKKHLSRDKLTYIF